MYYKIIINDKPETHNKKTAQKYGVFAMNDIFIRILHSGERRVDSSWHGECVSVSESKLYFISDGEFYIISDSGEKTVLTKGSSYLVPAGYSYKFGCDSEMKHMFFHIAVSGFGGIDLFKGIQRPLSMPFADFSNIMLNYDDVLGKLRTESFICGVLYSLLSENGIKIENKHYSDTVTRALEYIGNNLSVQISVQELSERLFVAQSTLRRDFRRETGMSIGKYIDALIFTEAERMLKFTALGIGEISERLGFGDQFYFARRFGKKYGIAPSRYRSLNVDI